MTDRIAWIDLETTGLDERTCSVLEVGVIVTDWALDVVAERSWLVAHEGPVSAFIAGMHGPGGSGLLDLCATAAPAGEIDVHVLRFLAEHAGRSPILGGRNAHFDRRFLRARLPWTHDALSHRSLDLTTLWLAFDHWVTPTEKGPQHHRALPDLRRDLDEMRRYRALLGRLREVTAECDAIRVERDALRAAVRACERAMLGEDGPDLSAAWADLHDLLPEEP